ncbi:MAG: hypothetical protein OHK0052_23950 [Anaerolineales bacterium]
MKHFWLWIFVLWLLTACASNDPVSLGQVATLAPSATPLAPALLPEVGATPSEMAATPLLPTPTEMNLPASATPTPTPLVAPPESVRFAAIGDFGQAGEPLAAVATLVKSWQPDLVITLGDNNYPNGAAETIDANVGQYFHEFIGNYQGNYGDGAAVNRFFPTLGNHDYDTDNAQPYLDYFTLPGNERYYDFVWGPVHFFAVNSDSREPDGVGRTSIQADWLRTRLSESTSPWKVVYFHAAPYSSGQERSTVWMRWPFKEWGADLVLAGHDHVYERLEVDGLPYVVNGLGGGVRYAFQRVLLESKVRFRENYGALLIQASGERLLAQFVAIDGKTVDGFTLTHASVAPEVKPTLASVQTLPSPMVFGWQAAVNGLDQPVGLAVAPGDARHLFVVEQPGRIRIVDGESLLPEPFLDLTDRVGSEGNEQGLLSVAFHPLYAQNGFFFVNYTNLNGNTVISRFQVTSDPLRADPNSEQKILSVPQPYANHNGGHLLFGPDGALYIGLGDGGSAGDPQNNAQNPNSLLGKMLRLDVDNATPYGIPGDNPFVNGDGRGEVWALGLRNPWRYAFDSLTGELYIGDVGQNRWEEVSVLPAGKSPGWNLGWRVWEGLHRYSDDTPDSLPNLVAAVAEYDHSLGCSITGGEVYRGSKFPAFYGVYLYADYCSGRIWGLVRAADGNWQSGQLYQLSANPTAFVQTAEGNLWMASHDGTLYRLQALNP